ncbi:MAG: regulatory protein RecX, partial [Phycisphaerales bacterium JB059]
MSGSSEKARRAALRMLERRAYSRRELVDRLERRGHDREAGEEAVRALADAGIVDDRALGESVVRAELARVPAGRALLEMKLVKRGIDREMASEIVREALAERASDEDAEEVARRHLRSLAPTL